MIAINQNGIRSISTCVMVLILSWLSGCASYRTNTDLEFGAFEAVWVPSDFLILEGDLVDIPYTRTGPIKAIVKKLSVFHDNPTIQQVNLVLFQKAAAIGADAVIFVQYESGESWDSWGYLQASGIAVKTQRKTSDEKTAKEEIVGNPQFSSIAEEEITSKEYDKVLWIRALSLAEGDVEKQKGIYVNLRSDQLASQARVYTWGYSFIPPGTDGWEKYGPDKETDTSMQEKKGKKLDELNTLSGSSYRITPDKTDQELVELARNIGRYGDEEGSRYNVVKLEAEFYPHPQARCARSLHIVEDKEALLSKSGKRGLMIRDVQALLCVHPTDDVVAVVLRYSHRHRPGKRDPDFIDKANRVFESLAFTKK